ncbi:MAG: 3-phosphoserine/phosphohydroxythreonine transaminase [Spirochaetia bacterium]|nr:3-phosphoserine/phosphohydroxythreonine transaminase [Spirochaetia bacterium]MCF7946768.1 3-phosphoserine/phosphohydroxythreonine transaminase [Spirochaetia bacterium]MCF7953358.1 3-phosphoserine/phosphohydroxythreonine transaminase [Spirochaetales bacterium]
MNRKKNFFAGPSVLPVEVLNELHDNLLDFDENGYSMIEASHRGPVFDNMYHDALDLIRELMGIPDDYDIFFLGGGATLQFAMIPMNFLGAEQKAQYIKSGAWSNKACDDAQKLGNVDVVFDGKDSNYTTLPDPEKLNISQDASYFYLCSNETIGGIEWQDWPETGDVPLIADMSSDILSRPVPAEKFSMIYAGVQKNLGPAGATLVILKRDMLKRSPSNIPAYLNYNTHAKKDGLYNTPPVFSIWAVKLVLEWIKKMGGAEAMEKRAIRKSGLIYNTIDSSDGFYRSPVDADYRSKMNIVFRLRNEELEKKFLEECSQEGMMGLKGHRSVGGCRASVYNSLPEEDVQALADFMKEFARKNG